MIFSAIYCEFAKLRNSLVLLLCIAAPAMVAILSGLILLDRSEATDWYMFSMQAAAMWSYFMLPMTVTALTILIAQIDHGPKAWNHLLALPVPRWHFYAAKAFVVVSLVGAMSAALVVLLPAAGGIVDLLLADQKLKGAYPWFGTASLIATMFAGSLLLTAIQLWASLRFRSFVPPLILGIGGTFVAVAATASRQGAFFPWLIPTNALGADPERVATAIQIGFYGGIAVGIFMLFDMGHKQAG
ncbi:ABC transporter permease [Allopontixanthobacter sp.]|uniref:ABC transporter permease n=1 Tax=Allopontixanthobacter sp. TaxID=2906452 RepID=UPI002ABB9D82|nr:ABC transporter permease [Allopontixanthobacter sp.]MDZ4308086.1 ABC transporter permease [Allopontixanthobacter sp.]